jgi:hypothetical protein
MSLKTLLALRRGIGKSIVSEKQENKVLYYIFYCVLRSDKEKGVFIIVLLTVRVTLSAGRLGVCCTLVGWTWWRRVGSTEREKLLLERTDRLASTYNASSLYL